MRIKVIKRFSRRVFDAVTRLLPQLTSGSKLITEKHFREILRSERTHFIIAEADNEQIVGILTIATYDIPSGSKVWIEDVVVDESHRGKGIGKKMTLFAIDFAKSIGAESIDLTSRPSRIAANKLYQELGFELRETNVYRYLVK